MENMTFAEYRELLKQYKMLITTTNFKDEEFRRIKEILILHDFYKSIESKACKFYKSIESKACKENRKDIIALEFFKEPETYDEEYEAVMTYNKFTDYAYKNKYQDKFYDLILREY